MSRSGPTPISPPTASSHIADVLRSRANEGAASTPAHSLTTYTNGHTLHVPETHPAREPRVRLLRHRHFREVAQTAAAILVVVMLAGLLAVVFQNQSGSHQGGLGGASTPTIASVNDPTLSALQAEAHFQLYAPTWLPDGWTLQATDRPINVSGYSQVILTYADSGQTQGINILESWPLHLDSLSLPPAVARNARPIDLGNDRSGYIFHDADLIRLWWQQGDVAIQFQNGLTGPQAPPDKLITEDEVIRIAKSMSPVAKTALQPTPGSTTVSTAFPMTATSNGISVTLESVMYGDSRVRFLFSVKLPPEIASASDIVVEANSSEPIVQADGITAGANDPVWQFSKHLPGEQTSMFSVEYSADSLPNSTVTVTLKRLPFTATPSNPNTDEGPWTFTMKPDDMMAEFQALVNANNARALITVPDAQGLVGFPLIQPQLLPNFLTRQSPQVSAVTILPHNQTTADFVRFSYWEGDAGSRGVKVGETTLSITMPYILRDTLYFIGGDGTPVASPLDDWSQDSLTIDGVTVSEIDTIQATTHIIYYTWEHNGVWFVVYAPLDSQLTDSVLQQMVTSMIDLPSSITLTPVPPSGTPVQPLLTPSAKLPDQESASRWANNYTSSPDGPAPVIDHARLMTFADAMNQPNADKSWTGASPNTAEPSTPVWVVEVQGAKGQFVCPIAYMQCDLTHIQIVVNAQTAEFVGMYLPTESLGPPTS